MADQGHKGVSFRGPQRLPKYRRRPDLFGAFELTENDENILAYVHDYRFVRHRELAALVGGNERHLASRLQGLFHHGYVARLVPKAKLRLSEQDAGSPKMVYVLDRNGAEHLAERRGVSLRDLPWRKPEGNLQWFVEHHLGVSEFRAVVELALRERPDLTLEEWRQDAGLRDKTQFGDQTYRVNPDAYFRVIAGKRRNFFLEFDRGTEEPSRLYERFMDYGWYLRSKRYAEQYQGLRPEAVRVLFVGPDEARLRVMHRQLEAAFDAIAGWERGRGLHRDETWSRAQPGWFWFTTERSYALENPDLVLGPIWRKGLQKREVFPLFESSGG